MAITASMVKELREMTGAGMMDCKKALNETNGDMDAAIEFLRKNGQAKAEKKAGRIAAEGIVKTVVKDDKVAAIVEVNSETDFVAKNDEFQGFVEAVVNQVADSDAADMDAFLAEPWACLLYTSAPLVTMGCVMMRVCNLDTCPVGVATQNPELRKRFAGKPEYVVNFMRFIAEELREYMAKLGVRTVDELVGRTDLLKIKDVPTSERAAELDLSRILYNPYAKEKKGVIFNPKKVYDFELDKTLDEKVLVKQLLPALEKGQKRSMEIDVTNTDRTLGTIFGSEITRRYPEGLEEDTYVIKCNGAGGQSFGAFIPKGLTLELTGDSNDYFGKGLSGGKLVVCPPQGIKFKAEDNIIIGNVALYGATSGKAFINGVAGERFCVRNSGATAEMCIRDRYWHGSDIVQISGVS